MWHAHLSVKVLVPSPPLLLPSSPLFIKCAAIMTYRRNGEPQMIGELVHKKRRSHSHRLPFRRTMTCYGVSGRGGRLSRGETYHFSHRTLHFSTRAYLTIIKSIV